jgi:HSP20 family protein
MAADKEYQDRDENSRQGSSQSFAASTDTANRSESGRGERERTIQSGREGSRSTGIARRQQTSPSYGTGRVQNTPFVTMRRMAEDMDRLLENFGLGRAGLGTGFGLQSAFGTDIDRGNWSGLSNLDQAVWMPQVETFRRGDNLVIRADLPGLKKDDVKVEIEDGILAISGERREENEEDRDDYYRSERTYGQFYRAIPLPEGVDENKCDASFKDGVLEVTIPAPKREERKARTIKVK